MNKLKELRNKVKKNNKGFSLVELIVVIVILAILIGVTIGGIYQYVNKSRVNTDINNAASIQSTLSTIGTDANLNKICDGLSEKETYTMTWGDSDANNTAGQDVNVIGTKGHADAINNAAKGILTDGLPKSQTNQGFTLTITLEKEKGVVVSCKTGATNKE